MTFRHLGPLHHHNGNITTAINVKYNERRCGSSFIEKRYHNHSMQPTVTQEISLTDRLFGWWYRIAAPPEVSEEAPLHERTRVRSGRLTSVIYLIQIIFFLTSFTFSLFYAPFTAPASGISLGLLLIGIFLNRIGKTVVAGIFIITVLVVGLTLDFLVTPGGLSPFLLSLFDFFVVSELVAASLITPWATLPVTLINCLITIGLILFLPKTPEMITLLHSMPYYVYVDSIEIQIMVSVTISLWVSSTYNEMKRANSAEEVNKLAMMMITQQQEAEQEKQRLEESIQQIISVHTQIANGNFNARVQLTQQNVLWSVAGSLNNLLNRLQRWRHDVMQLQKNEQALQQLLYNVQLARKQRTPLPAYKTGTSLDALIAEISKGLEAPQQPPDQSIIAKPLSNPGTLNQINF